MDVTLIIKSPTIKVLIYFIPLLSIWRDRDQIYYLKTTPYEHKRYESTYAEDDRRRSKVQGLFS